MTGFRTLAVAVFVLQSALGAAQTPNPDPLLDMQTIAQALGVRCEYCHVGRRGEPPPVGAIGKPKQQIAREMIAMTRELNAKVQAATDKSAADATPVTCITCHRGVPIPRQLSDIVARTVREKGAAEAVAQYRDLRRDFFGRQSYDFGEDELLKVATRFAQTRPADAITLLETNVEFYPRSVRSYVTMAQAYTRKLDDESAIKSLEKALEIDPENGVVKGQLAQLQRYQRRQ
jgi:tetratricopeptide (TPR) repeat protein